MSTFPYAPFLALAVVAAPVAAQTQNVYKSVDPDGHVTYGDKAPDNAADPTKSTVNAMPSARQNATQTAPAPPPSANSWLRDDLAPVMMTGLMLAGCESAHLGFQGRQSPAYLQWRKQYEPRLTQIEKDSDYAAMLRNAQQEGVKFKQKAEVFDNQDRLRCDALLVDLGSETAATQHPEHFRTPEATWAHFLQSLRTGDREAVRSCMWGELSARIAPALDSMTPGQMREFANSFGPLRFMGDGKNPGEVSFRSYNVTRHTQDEHSPLAGQVDFQRSNSGWRISSM